MVVSAKRYSFRFRIILTGIILGMMYGVVVARAVDLMVVRGPETKKQHQRVERLTPKRGPILDFNGAVLAESVSVHSAYAHPRLVPHPTAAASILAQILEEKEERLLEKLLSNGRFVWIKRAISPEQALAIKRNAMDGVVIVGEYARYYPQGSLAAQLIGFVGAYGKGLEGLERKFDSQLAGNEERFLVQRDALGKKYYSDPDSLPEPRGGDRIVLTIDARIQAIVEEALESAITANKAQSGMAAIMEVQTGRILAMAVQPTFNPNRFREYEQETFRNRFITDIFEPGSTFKVFTLAALVDSGESGIYEEIYCEDGAFELDGRIINDTHPHGWFTIEEIVVHSSNIGAAKLGLKLGRDIMGRYVKKFGFGSCTGIELPGESKGLARPFRSLSRVGLANVAFGQGIGVTGIQMLTAFNAVASGGKLIKPRIVDRIEDSDGNPVRSFRPKVVRTVLQSETVRDITHVFVNVVHGGGTGRRAAPVGYTVAGKTGTAQKVDHETGGYYSDKYVASFVGWAPAEKPKISVLVIVNDPQDKPWGGVVAAPVFGEIVGRTLPILGVLPDEPVNAPPALTSASFGYQSEERAEGPKIITDTTSTFVANCENCMPDLAGLSLRKVLQMAQEFGASVEIVGSGRTIRQNPLPGEPLDGVTKWRVELATAPN